MEITITRIRSGDEAESSWLREVDASGDLIRRRAYEIFETRGFEHGVALDHWLEAEREATFALESELVETVSSLQLNVHVPAELLDGLSVGVSGEAVILRDPQVSRKLDLPAAIDVDRVTAVYGDGILSIFARKAALNLGEPRTNQLQEDARPLSRTASA